MTISKKERAEPHIITPEERDFWRHYLEQPDCIIMGPGPITLRLLNALEAAEARADRAEKDAIARRYELAHAGTQAKLIEAEDRAERILPVP